MKNDFEHYEKEFDDQVYEDEFYEENFDEEELVDEEVEKEDVFDDDDDDDLDDFGEKKIHVSYACEDCDYRWEEIIIKKDEFNEDEPDVLCPMCGSLHVDQI